MVSLTRASRTGPCQANSRPKVQCRVFQKTSSSASRPAATRSRAPSTSASAARASGIGSVTRRARSPTTTMATSPAITTTVTRDDIGLLKRLSVDVYRFSIAWPAHSTERLWQGHLERPRLLRSSRRRAARRWHRALALPLPLGPASDAAGQRRLAVARDRLPLSRLRRGGDRPPR